MLLLIEEMLAADLPAELLLQQELLGLALLLIHLLVKLLLPRHESLNRDRCERAELGHRRDIERALVELLVLVVVQLLEIVRLVEHPVLTRSVAYPKGLHHCEDDGLRLRLAFVDIQDLFADCGGLLLHIKREVFAQALDLKLEALRLQRVLDR